MNHRVPRSVFIAAYLTIAAATCVNLVLVAAAATPVLPWLVGAASLGAVSAAVVAFSERKLGREPRAPRRRHRDGGS